MRVKGYGLLVMRVSRVEGMKTTWERLVREGRGEVKVRVKD